MAIVQLVRYPASAFSGWLFEAVVEAGGDPGEPMIVALSLGIGLALAAASVLGIWALAEGLQDAGGRSVGAAVVAFLVAAAFGMLLLVPSLMAGVTLDLELMGSLLSIALNVLFLFVQGLLAGRAVAGALAGIAPRQAWIAGAAAGIVLFVLPALTLVTLLVNSFLFTGTEPLAIQFLAVVTYFGWPLLTIAIAAGMGRLAAPAPDPLGTGFVVRGKARFVPAS